MAKSDKLTNCEACLYFSVIIVVVTAVALSIIYALLPVTGLVTTCIVHKYELSYGSGCYAIVTLQAEEKNGTSKYVFPGHSQFFRSEHDCASAHKADGTIIGRAISCVDGTKNAVYTTEYAYTANIVTHVLCVTIVTVAACLEVSCIGLAIATEMHPDIDVEKVQRKPGEVEKVQRKSGGVEKVKRKSGEVEKRETRSKLKST